MCQPASLILLLFVVASWQVSSSLDVATHFHVASGAARAALCSTQPTLVGVLPLLTCHGRAPVPTWCEWTSPVQRPGG